MVSSLRASIGPIVLASLLLARPASARDGGAESGVGVGGDGGADTGAAVAACASGEAVCMTEDGVTGVCTNWTCGTRSCTICAPICGMDSPQNTSACVGKSAGASCGGGLHSTAGSCLARPCAASGGATYLACSVVAPSISPVDNSSCSVGSAGLVGAGRGAWAMAGLWLGPLALLGRRGRRRSSHD